MDYKDLPSKLSDIRSKAVSCAAVCEAALSTSKHSEPGYVSVSACDRSYVKVNAEDFSQFMREQEIKFRAMLPPLEHAHETLKSVAEGLLNK